MLSVSSRWYVTDQFWKRGSVRPSGVTAMTFPPILIVGSMNGGNWTLDAGKPASRWCAGKMPFVLFGANGFDANPCVGPPAANWLNETWA